jgi:hypothetical protein
MTLTPEDLLFTFRDPFTGQDRTVTSLRLLLRDDVPVEDVKRPVVRLSSADAGPVRYGGWPRLAPEQAWPSTQFGPLAFIAEIDFATLADALGEAHPSELPREGLLSFFYARVPSTVHYSKVPKGHAPFAIVHAPDASRCVLREPATDVPTYVSRAFSAQVAIEGPCPGDIHRRHDPPGGFKAAAHAWLLERGTPRPSNEQLLGHPQWIQNDARITSYLESFGVVAQPASIRAAIDRGLDLRALAERATRARLLFQLNDTGVPDHDGAFFYLLIDPDDLAAHRFERCLFVHQFD